MSAGSWSYPAFTPKYGTGRGDQRNLAGDLRDMNNLSDMRQKRLLTAALLLAALPLVPVRAQEASGAAEIRSLELKMLDCYMHREVEVFAAVLDEDFVITFEDGSTYSKTGYLSYSASSSTHVAVAEIPEMKVRMHGDTAIVTGVYHENGVDNRKTYDYRDRFTDVWMKKSGKWRLVAAHYAVPAK
jgi:ketosteroid isomerase-like protein